MFRLVSDKAIRKFLVEEANKQPIDFSRVYMTNIIRTLHQRILDLEEELGID